MPDLQKADYQLSDRDAGSGYRRAITERIAELESSNRGERPNIVESMLGEQAATDTHDDLVDRWLRKLKSVRPVAIVVVCALVIIGVGDTIEGLDRVKAFFGLSPQKAAEQKVAANTAASAPAAEHTVAANPPAPALPRQRRHHAG